MKPLIREKRKLILDKRCITPNVISQIAMLIDKEVKELGDNDRLLVNYSIDSTDNSSYESQSAQIFATDGLLYSKVINKVVMRFSSIDYSKNVEVQLLQSEENEHGENYITVSGDDPIWVNGTISRLSELALSSEMQFGYGKWIGWTMIILWLAFIIPYWKLFVDARNTYPNTAIALLLVLVIPFGSFFGTLNLIIYMQSLWPSMELQTGPGYLQIHAKKRRTVYWIVTCFVIPVLLTVFYDIFKSKVWH